MAVAVAVAERVRDLAIQPNLGPAGPKVAIAHDYLTQRGGAERVVLSMLRAFPDATIYTTLYDPQSTYPEFANATIVTSPLNRVGFLRRNHRLALPFLAWAARRMRPDAEVVLMSSSGWAHGFSSDGRTVVYCYSPARWLYQTETYLGGPAYRSLKGLMLRALRPWLLRWDRRAAGNADAYLAISRVVQKRIKDAYGLDAEVVPAPHTLDVSLPQAPIEKVNDWAEGGFHLTVSRLLPYKNVDKAIEAFRGLPAERLLIIGSGPEQAALMTDLPPNVRLVSELTDDQMRWAYAHCVAVVAPSIEDFGLTPLEGAVFGKPTFALRAGGYLDTIDDGVSGCFFDQPSAEAIRAAILSAPLWDAERIRDHADSFAEDSFHGRLRAALAHDGESASRTRQVAQVGRKGT